MKIKESEIKAVIADLTKHLEADFQEAAARLAKADGDEKPEFDLAAENPVEPKEESAKMDEPAPEAAPEHADPAQESAPLSVESLQAEYAQLSDDELAMHEQAIAAAKQAKMPPAAPEAPIAPPAPVAMKAEEKETEESKEESKADIEKSEKITALEALVKNQTSELEAIKNTYKKDMDTMAKAVQAVLQKPERKAITSIAYLNKSEVETTTFTVDEAKSQLKPMLGSLTKAEREVATDFYLGKATVEAVTPIIHKHKK